MSQSAETPAASDFVPDSSEKDVGVTLDGEVMRGRDRGGIDFAAFADVSDAPTEAADEAAAATNADDEAAAAAAAAAKKKADDEAAAVAAAKKNADDEAAAAAAAKKKADDEAAAKKKADDEAAAAAAAAAKKKADDEAAAVAAAAKKNADDEAAAAAAAKKKADDEAAAAGKPKKPQRALVEAHPNGRDALMAAPAYAALWLDHEHVVVGGGGGGARYESPNALALLRATLVPMADAAAGTTSPVGRQAPWSVVQTIDCESAGTVQCLSAQTSSAVVERGAAGDVSVVHFAAAHPSAVSIVRYERAPPPGNAGTGTRPVAATAAPPMRVVCRVALDASATDSDAKPVAIAALAGAPGQDLIFAAQDNQTVTVFRLSTLLQWAQRVSALRSLEPPQGAEASGASDVVAVASTPCDVVEHALSVVEFPVGGRVYDMRVKVLDRSQLAHGASTTAAAAAGDASAGAVVLVAVCTRDKTLLVGHFDVAQRLFMPVHRFAPDSFGFGPGVAFSGKSVRCCAFAPDATTEKRFDTARDGAYTATSIDLFVALQPLRTPLSAARVTVTVEPHQRAAPSAAAATGVVVTAAVTALALADGALDAAYRIDESPAACTALDIATLGDTQTSRAVFVVATVDGSLVEFGFAPRVGTAPVGSAAAAAAARSTGDAVRRVVRAVHDDPITCLAVAAAPTGAAASEFATRMAVTTDIARRVAFRTWDRRARGDAIVAAAVGGEGVPDALRCDAAAADRRCAGSPPPLFAVEPAGAGSAAASAAARVVTRLTAQWLALAFVGALLALLASFVASALGFT